MRSYLMTVLLQNERTCSLFSSIMLFLFQLCDKKMKLEMWANAQRDGRPAKYRWRPLFNAAKFG